MTTLNTTPTLVTINDFTQIPYDGGDLLPQNGEFDIFSVFRRQDKTLRYSAIVAAMEFCPKLQNDNVIAQYLATNPEPMYIYWLLKYLPFARQEYVMAALMASNPPSWIISSIMDDTAAATAAAAAAAAAAEKGAMLLKLVYKHLAYKPEVIAAIGLPTATAEPEPTPEPEPTTSPATSCLHEGVLLVAALREYRRAYGKGANTAGVQVAVDIALDRFKAAVSRLQVESRKRVADANFESKPVIDAIEIAQAAIVITHRASNKKAAVAAVDQAVRKLPYLIKLKL